MIIIAPKASLVCILLIENWSVSQTSVIDAFYTAEHKLLPTQEI